MYSKIKHPERLEGITHYGMPIKEITRKFHQDDAVLEIVYSKNLSDDNMDDYVKRFYDEFLHQIEAWLYDHKLPAKNMKIVISNCKFCKVGYCKKKNIKEVTFISYCNGKAGKTISFKHIDILNNEKYADMAKSAVIDLMEN